MPKKVSAQISDLLLKVATTGELPSMKALSGNLYGLHSIRVSDYRILVEIDLAEAKLQLVDVGHRRKIYR